MLCPKCNQPVAEGARYCGHCGQPLSAEAAAPPDGAAAAAAAVDSGSAGSTRNLIERAKNILLTPKSEWPIIEAEPTSVSQLFKGYVIPLAAFAAVMLFIRASLIGIGIWRLPVMTGLLYALLRFGSALLGVYLVGLIIDRLAPTFAGQRNQRQAFKTAAYAFTPAAFGALLGLFPVLGPVLQLAAALYSIYLLYLGLPLLMRNPQDKAMGYTATTVVCAIFVMLLLGVIMSVFGRMTGYSPYAGPYGYR
jgi:Yip1 domain/Double zinc ribbon